MRRSMRTNRAEGFTLAELLVVVGIFALLAAVAVPRISRYFRNYQMNSAVREVTGEIMAARTRAVMKTVNYGSVFYVTGINTYRTALEDDQTPPRDPRRLTIPQTLDTATYPGQTTPNRSLPGDVVFGTGCVQGGVFAANDTGIRFTRLGAACDPGVAECGGALAPPGPPPNRVMNTVAGSSICLTQPSTGLRRLIRVSPGGRIMSVEGQG